MKKFVSLLAVCIFIFPVSCFGYGNQGHKIVGAIADLLLKKSPAVQSKLNKILEGMTLERAATIPDDIKTQWDNKPESKRVNLTGVNERINRELLAFHKANKFKPSHHEFHYTDVPVEGTETYGKGTIGRSKVDIVHMVPLCVGVLKGTIPAKNARKITKSVAVILLAHYLGDIHQPLHAGAEFFDKNGKIFEPAVSAGTFSDQGGNKLTLILADGHTAGDNLHSYWDKNAVTTAFGNQSVTAVAKPLAGAEPAKWKLSGAVETWAEKMADEVIPIARQAHAALEFSAIVIPNGVPAHPKEELPLIVSGNAKEIKSKMDKVQNGASYSAWAGNTVKSEIHKAGWRLAAVLGAAL